MFGRGGKRGERREPVFDVRPGSDLDLRLTADDRPSGARMAERTPPRRAARREEPVAVYEPDHDDADFDAYGEPDMPPRKNARRKTDGGRGGNGRGRGGGGRGRSGGGRRKRSLMGRLFRFAVLCAIWGSIAIAGLIAYQFTKLPPIHQLAVPQRPPSVTLIAPNTMVLATRGETAGFVPIKDMPEYLPRAVVAIEDRRFYDHFGVDPQGIARAFVRNMQAGRLVEGGSTLTQQLAKNLFLTTDRSYERKLQELILSVWLELKYSKDEILEMYLNRVYFGAGAHGVEAAARRYFGKSVHNVSLAEAAILAGLVQAPSRLAPTRNPEGAEARARLVLAAMAEVGFISQNDARLAFQMNEAVSPPPAQNSTGYVADLVVAQLEELIGSYDEDIFVEVTVDPTMQSYAERALKEGMAARAEELGVEQGALVALSPDGAIRALVGGRDYATSAFNRAVTAKRQPGSAFKPIVYLAALEAGMTPGTVRVDRPVRFGNWAPENFDKKYRGEVTLTQALAMSLNTIAAQLAVEVGPAKVVELARQLGITSPMQNNASIALGTAEVSPLELATAFTPLANGGYRTEPYLITRITTADNRILYERPQHVDQNFVVAPEYVGMMNLMLRQTLRTGTARRAELPGWDAAGKTGTSQDFRDAWFVGYTSHMVAAVWLGNDDNRPTKRASGSNLPVDIWSQFMQHAHSETPTAPLPGEEWVPVASVPRQPERRAYEDAPAPIRFIQRLFGG